MAQTINGGTAYIAGQAETVDPDHDNPNRANEGYTGTDPAYENAVDHTYAPQGDESLVPEPVAFGAVEVSKEQAAANKAHAKADEAQAKADAAAQEEADKVQAEKAEAAAKAATPVPTTPVTLETSTPSAPAAPSTNK